MNFSCNLYIRFGRKKSHYRPRRVQQRRTKFTFRWILGSLCNAQCVHFELVIRYEWEHTHAHAHAIEIVRDFLVEM